MLYIFYILCVSITGQILLLLHILQVLLNRIRMESEKNAI